jgi:hypothetical protein
MSIDYTRPPANPTEPVASESPNAGRWIGKEWVSTDGTKRWNRQQQAWEPLLEPISEQPSGSRRSPAPSAEQTPAEALRHLGAEVGRLAVTVVVVLLLIAGAFWMIGVIADHSGGGTSSTTEVGQTGESCDSLRAKLKSSEDAVTVGISAQGDVDYYQGQLDQWGC